MSDSQSHIAHIRKDYCMAALDESIVGDDPLAFFKKWFEEALDAQISEVNAMTLATCGSDSWPHARIVLLKGLESGGFTFFTNYNSSKGNEIASNNRVSLLFFWKELERQVRIEGVIEKVSASESDTYFNSRPDGSKIGAWASPQSQVIAGRAVIENFQNKYLSEFEGKTIPRPEHWGGYRVVPAKIEFWQGRSSRLHDRLLFTLNSEGQWVKNRLAP